MNYRRGDIVLVLFPDSNLRTSKRRPALVVQADQLGTGLGSDYRSDDYQQYGPCATPEQGSGAHQEQERERIGATDGFGDHDRQPRDHPRFGNRSGHRGIHRAGRAGRSFTSNSGIVAGPSRSANRGGDCEIDKFAVHLEAARVIFRCHPELVQHDAFDELGFLRPIGNPPLPQKAIL